MPGSRAASETTSICREEPRTGRDASARELRVVARRFHALKAKLEEAVREAEAGEFEAFDPLACEPDASAG